MSQSIPHTMEQRFFAADPLDAEGVLRTDTALGLEPLAGSRTLVNARTLLAALVEQPAKVTTELKNLTRAFVKRMTEEMSWPPGYVEQVWRHNRVLDETDVPRLFILRHLMEVAGLVNRRKGAFHATRLGKRLLAPERAGELFDLLLRTYLGRLNWAFVDVGPEDRAMQSYCVHALWTIRRLAAKGATADEITSSVAVSNTVWLEGRPWPGGPGNLRIAVQRRLLEPLWDFGLLAREHEDQGEGPPLWRVTPLFDAAIRFELGMGSAAAASSGDPVVTLKVTLRGTEPPVWRRLEVPASLTLDRLHELLVTAMGWFDYHLHAFEIDGRRYGVPDDSFGLDDTLPEEEIVLTDLVGVGVERFEYEYDFGDGWQHEIVVESLAKPESGVSYPRCTAGERACPPEDCGGIPGFAEFVEAMADTRHPEHRALKTWYGGEFDPAAFSAEQTSSLLRVLWTGEIPDDREV
ncbi:MAG: plasmid pRiA4b ORF-3 family protein [Actinomycetota bacterium]|nr:plasmid pRiA4b ORF-3 family protein [Actinomycetota bacterium]